MMIMIKVKQIVVIKKTMKQVMIITIKNVLEMMTKNNNDNDNNNESIRKTILIMKE